jgi:Na+-translocating ferredoxin:NAD+ oxidoreductase RnfG subunit
MLVNHYLNLSNPKAQLKLFYLISARIIALYNKLVENQVDQYYARKAAKIQALNESLFNKGKGKTTNQSTDSNAKMIGTRPLAFYEYVLGLAQDHDQEPRELLETSESDAH